MPRRKQPLIADGLLDQLLIGSGPRTALADGGLLDGLKKALVERVLNAEMKHHLDGGEPDGRSNGRNGYGSKTVLTGTGKLDLKIPCDRLAPFDPQLDSSNYPPLSGFCEQDRRFRS
jgi:putative transposase